MIFIIGGYAQGKTEYARGNYEINDDSFCDQYFVTYIHMDENKRDSKITGRACIKNLNEIAFECFKENININKALDDFISDYPDAVIISTEIGNGIVPVDKEEREYREWMGRVQTYVASKADEVIRVVCGIGQKIK